MRTTWPKGILKPDGNTRTRFLVVCRRLRLACAWPILIGIATLSKLRRTNILDSSQRIKITRAEVRGIIARSLLDRLASFMASAVHPCETGIDFAPQFLFAMFCDHKTPDQHLSREAFPVDTFVSIK